MSKGLTNFTIETSARIRATRGRSYEKNATRTRTRTRTRRFLWIFNTMYQACTAIHIVVGPWPHGGLTVAIAVARRRAWSPGSVAVGCSRAVLTSAGAGGAMAHIVGGCRRGAPSGVGVGPARFWRLSSSFVGRSRQPRARPPPINPRRGPPPPLIPPPNAPLPPPAPFAVARVPACPAVAAPVRPVPRCSRQ